MNKERIKVQMIVNNQIINVMRIGEIEYISLTDLARYSNPEDPSGVIRNWMSNKNSFDFYSLWEELNNDSFNSVESHRIKIEESGYNRFTMTPSRWRREFNAIGIIPSSGRYSTGTYAVSEIALEFASWLSPEFKLYVIQEFQRLKKNESYQNKIDWQANRVLASVSYLVQTDAIKNIIVPTLTEKQKKYVYANEADVLNVALFGMTAKEWRERNPELSNKGNIRDYTDLLHLVILNNLENINAQLIEMKVSQRQRLIKLNSIAKKQMELIKNSKSFSKLKEYENEVNNKHLIS